MLSGGNIQKVIVAREFTSGAKFILANQPTRGIDVGTTEMIRKTLVRKSRNDGVATLLVSSDLNEILEVSDRLLVMKDGKIVAHFPVAGKVTADELVNTCLVCGAWNRKKWVICCERNKKN